MTILQDNRAEERSGHPMRSLWAQGGWIVELGLVFAGLVFLSRIFGGGALLAFNPHPFWVPVLLFATVHGLVPGLAAAAVAATLHWALSGVQPGIGADYYDQALALAKEPILWFSAAAMLGAYRDRMRGRIVALAGKVREYDTQRETIADYAEELREHIRKLEYAAAIRSEGSLPEFRDLLSRLGEPGAGTERDETLVRLCRLATGCRDASLLVREGDDWIARSAGSAAVPMARLVAARLEQGRVAHAFPGQPGADGDRPDCTVAAPVIDVKTTAINAILVMEGCPRDGDMRAALLLAELIARALAASEALTGTAPLHPGGGLPGRRKRPQSLLQFERQE